MESKSLAQSHNHHSSQSKSHPAKPNSQHSPKPNSRHAHFRYWLTLWIVIYALILTVGLFYPKGSVITIIKLTGVLLCSLYSIQIFPRDYLLQLAMIITFVADCFLTYDNISILGLMIFFVAQIVHLYRMTNLKNRPKVFILTLIGLFVIACVNLTETIPSIYIIVTFYTIALVSNIIASWRWHQEAPQSIYAKASLAGFILFACCDLCIGVSYMSLIHVFPAALYAPANYLAWLFYYPSQIFVSNSSKRATIDTKEGKC